MDSQRSFLVSVAVNVSSELPIFLSLDQCYIKNPKDTLISSEIAVELFNVIFGLTPYFFHLATK